MIDRNLLPTVENPDKKLSIFPYQLVKLYLWKALLFLLFNCPKKYFYNITHLLFEFRVLS
jgi:hypothetical protein